jgi:hypothetical protein
MVKELLMRLFESIWRVLELAKCSMTQKSRGEGIIQSNFVFVMRVYK